MLTDWLTETELTLCFRKEQEPETIYLKHVERQQQQQQREEVTQKYAPPQFMTPLKNVNVNEGEYFKLSSFKSSIPCPILD